MPRFLHTADWQIGKPFQSIEDPAKREALRKQRLDTITGLKSLIDTEKLDFVVVCGDLFDSATPDAATVSALCSAIGSLEVPVYAIPGNHDHAGPGCIWQQDFFLREKEQLAPGFHILLKPEPLITDNAVLLPCPLLRRQESSDPTAWLRSEPSDLPEGLPRIVLAHGSTQGFSSSEESDQDSAINQIDLSLLPDGAYTYIALGDWHGTKEIKPASWYAGTPEQDRFAKGEHNQPGQILIVEANAHPGSPSVRAVPVGRIGWHAPGESQLNGDDDLDGLEAQLNDLIGTQTGNDLLKLTISGTLSFAGMERLDALKERLRARLIRLQIQEDLRIEPSPEELDALTERQDPLIAQVARSLRDGIDSDPLARETLRELHLQIMKGEL